jgi:DNA-binding MarR family transcriptional regulator
VTINFMDTALLCRKADRRIADAVGMTVEEVHCLYAVATSMPSCVKILSDDLGLSAPRTSKVLRSLERRGYVVRLLHAEDRRMELIQLTPSGEEVAKRIIVLSKQVGDKLFKKEAVDEETLSSDHALFHYSR